MLTLTNASLAIDALFTTVVALMSNERQESWQVMNDDGITRIKCVTLSSTKIGFSLFMIDGDIKRVKRMKNCH